MAMYPDDTLGLFFSVVVAGGGLFVYSGTPAAGNLIASIASASGTDAYGNAYLAGFESQGNNAFAQLINGQLNQGSLSGSTETLTNGTFSFIDATTASAQPGVRLSTAPTGLQNNAIFEALSGSKDATKLTQFLLSQAGNVGPVTSAMAEIQTTSNTQELLALVGLAATQLIFAAIEQGDTNNRFQSDGNGKLSWGSGSGAVDTDLYRSAASTLTTDGAFEVGGATDLDGTLDVASTSTLNAAVTITAGGLGVTGGETADTIAVSSGQAAGGVLKVTDTTSTPTNPISQIIANAAADNSFGIEVTGDTNFRFRVDSNGRLTWGPGNATQDTAFERTAAGLLKVTTGSFGVSTAGQGLRVSEGANGKQGTATLVGGTVVVSNTSVTANSKIFIGMMTPGGTVGASFVTVKTAGTGFTVKSTSSTDTSVIAYEIFEPG